jgi:hypothetical protein
MLTNICCTDPDTAKSTGNSIRSPGLCAGVPHSFLFVAGMSGALGTGSGQGTESSSISDLGGITGNYIDSSGVNHGFVGSPFAGIDTFDVSDARW